MVSHAIHPPRDPPPQLRPSPLAPGRGSPQGARPAHRGAGAAGGAAGPAGGALAELEPIISPLELAVARDQLP